MNERMHGWTNEVNSTHDVDEGAHDNDRKAYASDQHPLLPLKKARLYCQISDDADR
jgi:hypothetical protein